MQYLDSNCLYVTTIPRAVHIASMAKSKGKAPHDGLDKSYPSRGAICNRSVLHSPAITSYEGKRTDTNEEEGEDECVARMWGARLGVLIIGR